MSILRFANSFPPRAVRTTAMIAALTLVMVASRPPEARGSCGDYLQFGSHRHVFVDAARIRNSAQDETTSTSDPSQPFPKCHGIECSQGNLPPLVPATLRLIERHEVCLLGQEDSPRPPDFRDYFSVVQVLPTRNSDRMFRPPKLETNGRG